MATIALVLITGLTTGTSSGTKAQSSGVSVDLSVLTDGGYSTSQPGFVRNRTLLMPGTAMPTSSYFGPAITITKSMPVLKETTVVETSVAVTEPVMPPTEDTPPPVPAAPETVPELEPAAAMVAEAEVVGEVMTTAVPEPDAPAAPALPPEPETIAQTTNAESGAVTSDVSAAGVETASVTPGPTALEPGRAMLVAFEGADTKLPANAKEGLNAIAATVSSNEDLRIQLMAYAGGTDLSSSKARRMSLSRALAVRSYFIERGVRSTRIDVRALGDKTDEQPINRVDVNITER